MSKELFNFILFFSFLVLSNPLLVLFLLLLLSNFGDSNLFSLFCYIFYKISLNFDGFLKFCASFKIVFFWFLFGSSYYLNTESLLKKRFLSLVIPVGTPLDSFVGSAFIHYDFNKSSYFSSTLRDSIIFKFVLLIGF